MSNKLIFLQNVLLEELFILRLCAFRILIDSNEFLSKKVLQICSLMRAWESHFLYFHQLRILSVFIKVSNLIGENGFGFTCDYLIIGEFKHFFHRHIGHCFFVFFLWIAHSYVLEQCQLFYFLASYWMLFLGSVSAFKYYSKGP